MCIRDSYFTYRYAGVDKKGDWLIYDKKGNVIPVAQGTEEDKSVTDVYKRQVHHRTCYEITARRQVQLSEFLTESHPVH